MEEEKIELTMPSQNNNIFSKFHCLYEKKKMSMVKCPVPVHGASSVGDLGVLETCIMA